MVRCQKPTGKCRWTRGGRREKTVSHARQCRSRHGSTRSNSRQCSVFRDKPRRHLQAILWKYPVCGLKSCSFGGCSLSKNRIFGPKSIKPDRTYSRGGPPSAAVGFYNRPTEKGAAVF